MARLEEEDQEELEEGLEIQEEVAVEEVVEDDIITVEGDEQEEVEEEVPHDAPAFVHAIRVKNKEIAETNRELKKKIKQLEAEKVHAPAPEIKIGPKPTLESVDYDADKFESALIDWTEKKRKVDEVANNAKKQAEEADKAWKDRLTAYEDSKKTLRVKDFEDAEEVVTTMFNQVQQGIIVNGADLPAELVYVIGRNPKRAKELAEIKDPVKFAFAVAKLESKLKVERKDTPAPEKTIRSGAVSGSAISSNLAKLKEEAGKTGNWDKYFAAKRASGK